MIESSETGILDTPPAAPEPTSYDWAHRVTYLRLLDADAGGADWREVVRLVFQLDPALDEGWAYSVWRSHLDRALWMARKGYKFYLLSDDRARSN